MRGLGGAKLRLTLRSSSRRPTSLAAWRSRVFLPALRLQRPAEKRKSGPETALTVWLRSRNLERAKGFEPSTPTLARLCSTPELHPRPEGETAAGRAYDAMITRMQHPPGRPQRMLRRVCARELDLNRQFLRAKPHPQCERQR